MEDAPQRRRIVSTRIIIIVREYNITEKNEKGPKNQDPILVLYF